MLHLAAAHALAFSAPTVETELAFSVPFTDGAVLQRDCGDDAHHNCSSLYNRFDGYVGPFAGTLNQQAAIIDQVRQDLAPYAIRVVTERPPPEVDYTMILYGDLGPQTFAGLAPYIDCGDRFPNDVAFAQGTPDPVTGATVIVHEAGHTWGMEHVESIFDNMFPVADSLSATFTDECQQIVGDTMLTPAAGTCVLLHQAHCDLAQQRSHQELLALFGPAVADVTPPVLSIDRPAADAVYPLGSTVPLVLTVTDEAGPQIFDLAFEMNGAFIGEDITWTRYERTLEFDQPGVYELAVTATDDAGNLDTRTVRFAVEEPEIDPESARRAVAPACRVGAHAPGRGLPAAAFLALMTAVRRRRAPRSPRATKPAT